ncbi:MULTISPECIES: Ger(x)C family spore germination protein [Bacillus]|uniref:Ger(X)C family spore germination protein n=1 Tax=Bacillus cereus TaxID=1396 RepID=A0A2C1MAI1_BACCE|nr:MULTISPECIES: Ger(x)C family spore germination protein [Bacillus]MDH4423471.1 Ger(x)C family spore germination protein [Bacillus cereus]PER22292.1 Ger(x)C family spore germination protein [Bacillus cereus]PFA59319.1 Ger(x)C family spore germination protein [Bacillus sp. AFS015896]PGL82417.1 Ger(x)C family spore germination protein [Bacillus sp. AFS054943]PGU06901.1 Ger(x)C family spore germination protein [Bacillus cereus]
MFQKRVKLLFILCASSFLSGCWDQEPLREARLAYSLGYDITEENKLQQTIELVKSSSGEQSSFENEIHSATGYNILDTSDSLKKNVTGNIRYFKYGVKLLGTKIQKKGILPYLDVAFRDPTNPTALVKLIAVDGETSTILEKKKVGNLLIGDFLKKKIKSLEDMSVFPKETLETVVTKMLDPGKDFTLPSIKLKGKEVVINGIALFNNDKLTGLLPAQQSVLFVLLTGNMGDSAHITQKLTGSDSSNTSDYLTFEISHQKLKRELKITTDKKGTVFAHLKLKLQVIALEAPRDNLYKIGERKKLNKTLSKRLTKEAKKITNKLQTANCDAFGIGRHLIAYHPDLWKKKNWNKDYAKVKFKPEVEVNILYSGVLK